MTVKDIFATVVVAGVAGAIAAFATVRMMNRSATVTGGLRVVDQAGRVRGEIKLFPGDTACVSMKTVEGDGNVRLWLEPGGSSYIECTQARATASIGVGSEHAYLHLQDAAGETWLFTSTMAVVRKVQAENSKRQGKL